jgi:hypothetical protein
LAWAGAALVGLVLFVVVGTPLLVRGRVLAHLVAPLLAPGWREQIGGHLDGRIFVEAQLGREPRAASISVD